MRHRSSARVAERDRARIKALELGPPNPRPRCARDQNMKTRKRTREVEAQLTPLQAVWQAVREKDAGKLRRVLRERRAELQGKLDTPNPTTQFRLTALIMCIERDFRAGVKLLLSEGASIDATTGLGGFTALNVAAQFGFAKLVKILQSLGVSIDLADNVGATPLFVAALQGRPDVVSLLLEGGANADLARNDGTTPLFMAADRGHPEVVSLLLEKGANADLAQNNGATPLFQSAQNGHPEVVSLLIEGGANASLAMNNGLTPLLMAAQNNYPEIASLLLKGGANVDLAQDIGITPLIMAAQNGNSEVVSLLIVNEAQLDLVTIDGLNALHIAAFTDRPEVCAILIAAGLDPAGQDGNGESALSHYGHWLQNNEPDAWDGVEDRTRPRLSNDEKRDRRALLVAARDAFLLQKKREKNWQRRAALMHALVGSGLRLTAAQQAEHAAFQAAMDYAAPIAPVPVDRLRDIFSNEGFVRTITTFV